MPTKSSSSHRSGFGVLAALRHEWREIGGLGRIALIGVVAAAILAIILGFEITTSVRSHLLGSRAEIIVSIIDNLPPHPTPSTGLSAAFDEAVRERLLGGETVRVKLWLPDGTILYSDDQSLVGQQFPLTTPAREAFAGRTAIEVSDLSDPAHAPHRHLGSLIEVYVPLPGDAPDVDAVFEVEQRTDRLEAALSRIERNVWLSIGAGLAVLGTFLGILVLARARDLNRRRRQAEHLLGALLRAQDEEQRRIVGYLHDDVGQPLYRLLYGIEGSKARLPANDPIHRELTLLADLARQVDQTLRAELRMLGHGAWTDLELERALQSLVETVAAESNLDIDLVADIDEEPDAVPRSMIVRAASEALTNVRKHADASKVSVRVASSNGLVVLDVTDNGRGASIVPGLGLTTTEERLESIGGSLEVHSTPGHGTRLLARVPARGST